jgi:hypothetical protein
MSMHWKIEKFLKRTNMSPTRFGRLAARDPRLVHDLRRGRELGGPLAARLDAFIAAQAGK